MHVQESEACRRLAAVLLLKHRYEGHSTRPPKFPSAIALRGQQNSSRSSAPFFDTDSVRNGRRCLSMVNRISLFRTNCESCQKAMLKKWFPIYINNFSMPSIVISSTRISRLFDVHHRILGRFKVATSSHSLWRALY